jgi:hypothetical protein
LLSLFFVAFFSTAIQELAFGRDQGRSECLLCPSSSVAECNCISFYIRRAFFAFAFLVLVPQSARLVVRGPRLGAVAVSDRNFLPDARPLARHAVHARILLCRRGTERRVGAVVRVLPSSFDGSFRIRCVRHTMIAAIFCFSKRTHVSNRVCVIVRIVTFFMTLYLLSFSFLSYSIFSCFLLVLIRAAYAFCGSLVSSSFLLSSSYSPLF